MTASAAADTLEPDRVQFRELSEQIAELSSRDGVPLLPYDPGLPHFSALPPAARTTVLRRLSRLHAAAQVVRHTGGRVHSAKLVWAYLKNARQTVPTDLIGLLRDEDCIDIYGADHQLVFANLGFFLATSYSLEQLYCVPWTALYEREANGVENALIQLCGQVMSPNCTGILDASHLPSYVGSEVLSRARRSARMRPRFCAPIFAQGATAGYLWANEVTLL